MLFEAAGAVWTVSPGELWVQSAQAVDPAAIVDAPSSVRAAVVFCLTVLFGGGVIYWYGGRLDGAVDASMESPLRSALYGIMTYGGVFALIGYAYSQLLRLDIGATALFVVAVVVFGVIVFSLSGLGFVVVGAWVTDVVGARDPWLGLIGVGTVGAIVWFLLPAVAGVLVWFGVTSIGIGGPARLWFHADAVAAKRD